MYCCGLNSPQDYLLENVPNSCCPKPIYNCTLESAYSLGCSWKIASYFGFLYKSLIWPMTFKEIVQVNTIFKHLELIWFLKQCFSSSAQFLHQFSSSISITLSWGFTFWMPQTSNHSIIAVKWSKWLFCWIEKLIFQKNWHSNKLISKISLHFRFFQVKT